MSPSGPFWQCHSAGCLSYGLVQVSSSTQLNLPLCTCLCLYMCMCLVCVCVCVCMCCVCVLITCSLIWWTTTYIWMTTRSQARALKNLQCCQHIQACMHAMPYCVQMWIHIRYMNLVTVVVSSIVTVDCFTYTYSTSLHKNIAMILVATYVLVLYIWHLCLAVYTYIGQCGIMQVCVIVLYQLVKSKLKGSDWFLSKHAVLIDM